MTDKKKILKEEDFKKSLKEYYSLRDWDEKGIPNWNKLKELDLEKYSQGIVKG